MEPTESPPPQARASPKHQVSDFERAVRHDAIVQRIKWIYRRSALNRASRAWWARALLRKEKK